MAKPDAPVKTAAGHYLAEDGLARLRDGFEAPPNAQAQAVLERLHHRCSLDHDPGMNDRMYYAGKRYEELAHLAGLSGIAAQNLLSAGSGGDPAHYMPVGETAERARAKVRKAWAILGTKVAGAVHAMIVEGKDAESVGRETSTYGSATACKTAGTTVLRIGLWMLVNAQWA